MSAALPFPVRTRRAWLAVVLSLALFATGSAAAVTDLTFAGARWIWTPGTSAAGVDRVFRTSHVSPAGRTATRAEILITADDAYELGVNGTETGETAAEENSWQSHVHTSALSPDRTVFAVHVPNGADSPGALIAVVRRVLFGRDHHRF